MDVDVGALLLEALRHPGVRAELRALVREASAGEQAAPPPEGHSPFATIDAYATRCRVSARTVRTWISRGLPHVRQGQVVRVRVADADAWLVTGGTRRASVLRAVQGAEVKRARGRFAQVG